MNTVKTIKIARTISTFISCDLILSAFCPSCTAIFSNRIPGMYTKMTPVCQNFWIFIQTEAVGSWKTICKQFENEKIPESIPVTPRKTNTLINVLFSWSSLSILEYSPMEQEAITTEVNRQIKDGIVEMQSFEDSSDTQQQFARKFIIIYKNQRPILNEKASIEHI